MTIEVAVLISIVSVAFSVYFGLKNAKRTDTKDIEERVKQDTRINCKLDEISKNVSDIKNDVLSLKTDVAEMDKRVTIIDQSVKSAHKRIDTIMKQFKMNIGD